MASDWYYKQEDEERGPYTFRDLVEMVREEKLTAEVLVRPHYTNEWQRADSVVGLFHMARRDPVTLPPAKQSVADQEDEFADESDLDAFLGASEETDSEAAPPVPEEVEKPGWLKRLLSLRNSKIPAVPVDPNREIHVDISRPAVNENNVDQPQEVIDPDHKPVSQPNEINSITPGAETEPDFIEGVREGAYSEDTWSSTVNAAVERIDARAPKHPEIPAPRQIVPAISLSFMNTPLFRKLMFAGAVILCLSAAIYWFVNWMGQGTLMFPFIGACSPLMFLLYSALSFVGVIAGGSLLILFSSSYLRIGFKIGAVIVTTNLTIFSLLNWSHDKANIFPSRKPTEAKLFFPLLGECSNFAYWMYFVDLVIFVAVITYFLASWLESQADDI